MQERAIWLSIFALWLALPGIASASDGVLEINDTCATTTGCFAGDTPGYPVTITAAGSYRLTSNLTVPASTNGVELANGVDLDLGGFEIAGPVSCIAGCPPAGSGSGVASTLVLGHQCAVSNGKVRGFLEDGVRLGTGANVRGLRITDVARHGVNVSGGSFVAQNQISRIGQNGIRFNPIFPSLYERNTITNTGQQSVVDGKPSGPNACTDQLCGASGKKLFYLTTTSYDGAAADAACAVGFHMASFWELGDTTALEYDTARGVTAPDSAQGPPVFPSSPGSNAGWIRTGGTGNSFGGPGEANCAAWSSPSPSNVGSYIQLKRTWDVAAQFADPWLAGTATCSLPLKVWCVQD